MVEDTSANHVFRFVQLRPKRTVRETQVVPLVEGTAFMAATSFASSPT